MLVRRTLYLLALPALLFVVSCSSSNSVGSSTSINGGASPNGLRPSSTHVVVVMEENHSYEQVIGSPAMPYLNGLASRYGLATQFYANAHPSIGNYFMLTTGKLITSDDGFDGPVLDDNIFRQVIAAGKTWKSYAESLPGVGYTGGDVLPYVKQHNPAAYMSDVVGTTQAANLVPFTQFAADLASGQLPNLSFLIPNQINNSHDCPDGVAGCADSVRLAASDNWLKTNIDPLLNDPTFQQDGILIITYDESIPADTAFGGGHVATIIASPRSLPGFQSTQRYQFENILRTISDALGLAMHPGASEGAIGMTEFFQH